MKTNDIGLLLLTIKESSKGKIDGRVRLQKTMFLLEKLEGLPLTYEFKPHYYGPFSRELERDAELLKLLGYIVETPESLGEGLIRYSYMLSEKGIERAKELVDSNPELAEKLKETLDKFEQIPTQILVLMAKSV